MDYSKLADQFVEEGAWQGVPVIAVSMFAKWLEEREAAEQGLHPTYGILPAPEVWTTPEGLPAPVVRLSPPISG